MKTAALLISLLLCGVAWGGEWKKVTIQNELDETCLPMPGGRNHYTDEELPALFQKVETDNTGWQVMHHNIYMYGKIRGNSTCGGAFQNIDIWLKKSPAKAPKSRIEQTNEALRGVEEEESSSQEKILDVIERRNEIWLDVDSGNIKTLQGEIKFVSGTTTEWLPPEDLVMETYAQWEHRIRTINNDWSGSTVYVRPRGDLVKLRYQLGLRSDWAVVWREVE